jgi:hypothetical protein
MLTQPIFAEDTTSAHATKSRMPSERLARTKCLSEVEKGQRLLKLMVCSWRPRPAQSMTYWLDWVGRA